MLDITPEQRETLGREFDGILDYISKLNEVSVPEGTTELGEVFNVLREDVVTNAAGQYSADLIAAAPRKRGDHIAVKKILNQ